jgi:hypothetical protein
LVHVTDQVTSRRFLVDTGAAFSIFPHQSTAIPNGPLLSSPAGRNIPCWDERRLDLSISGHMFQLTFLLAAVQFLILRIDFFVAVWPFSGPGGGILDFH